jgi:hypothetical protein
MATINKVRFDRNQLDRVANLVEAKALSVAFPLN